MEKHIKRRPAIVKPEEEFDYYEIDGEGLQEDTNHEWTPRNWQAAVHPPFSLLVGQLHVPDIAFCPLNSSVNRPGYK